MKRTHVTVSEEQHGNSELDARYQQLVELAPDGILVHDGGRVVLANASAVRLAGATSRAQLVGLSIDTFLDPPYLKAIQAQLTDSVSAAELAPPVRDTFRRLDGSELEVEVRAVAFMDHGRPSAHLVIRDITERLAAEQAARQAARQAEERLQQAQRMEAMGALAGGVAHEVNNMMAVILGSGDFLLRDASMSAESLTDVLEIMKAADRAAAVTRQLLAFGRRAVNCQRSVELLDFVRGVEPVVRRLLGEDRRLMVVTRALPRVWVDPGQLEQVVVNLVLNARDATPPGGTVTVALSESTLPHPLTAVGGVTIPAGWYATLVVRDTGIGIDPETQAHIFEPFFTTKRVGEGTGLGLAAAHGIVTQNDGYMTVTSVLGQGASFAVYLPALPPADGEIVEDHASLPDVGADPTHAGATVLVVDDEPAVRAIAARSLEHAGFRVIQAGDGADALEHVRRYGPPQLVIADLLTSGIGGVELARRLRERWPALPILYMSGYSAEELNRRGAIAADGELIQKPFTPGGLVKSVALALSRVG